MKRYLILESIVLVFLLLSPSAYAVQIGFDTLSFIKEIGQPIEVDVTISDLGEGKAPSLGIFDLNIHFDPEVLSIGEDDVKFGNYLGNPGNSDIDVKVVDKGTINIFESSILAPDKLDGSQPGAFTIATLTFKAIVVATSFLDAEIIDLGDSMGDLLLAEVKPGSVGPAPVPEPATLMLFGAGLAGLAGFGRKKFKINR